MAITLTLEEKVQLEKENSLVRELPGATGAEKGNYHNPATGKEIVGPVDPYHMTRRLRQGWRLGPASTELRAKWLSAESERKAEDDRREAEYMDSDEHKVSLQDQADRFNDAVATAVTQVLEKLGHKDETVVESKPPEQLDFFETVDAPPETGSKHVVPQASRSNLHLVDLDG